MPDYEVTLLVRVQNVEDDDSYFHDDTMDFLMETGILDDAEIQTVRRCYP